VYVDLYGGCDSGLLLYQLLEPRDLCKLVTIAVRSLALLFFVLFFLPKSGR